MGNYKNIVILSGGFSEEAKISQASSREIEKTLLGCDKNITIIDPVEYKSYSEMIFTIKKLNPDLVFNGLHGAEGENGMIQSLLTLENIPYTGSAQRASAIAMDKYISGILAEYTNAKIPKRRLIYKNYEYDFYFIVQHIGFPMVVKPNDSGSSVGISIINDKKDLEAATKLAFRYSEKIIIEQFITGRELTVTILGSEVLPVVEIIPKDGWYDYTNKYSKGNTFYDVPAKLTYDEERNIKRQALEIFNLFGCEVYGRVDFRYDGNDFYFLEVNTLPGMTPLSLTPMAAKEAGLDFKELLLTIIELSLNR